LIPQRCAGHRTLFSKSQSFSEKTDRGFAFLDRFLEKPIGVLHSSIVFWKNRSGFCISRSFPEKNDRELPNPFNGSWLISKTLTRIRDDELI